MECPFYWFAVASKFSPLPKPAPIWVDHYRKESSVVTVFNVHGTVLDSRWRMDACSMGRRCIINLVLRREYAMDKLKSGRLPIPTPRNRPTTSRIRGRRKNQTRRLETKPAQLDERPPSQGILTGVSGQCERSSPASSPFTRRDKLSGGEKYVVVARQKPHFKPCHHY